MPDYWIIKLWQLTALVGIALPLVVPIGLSTLGLAYVIWGFGAIIVEDIHARSPAAVQTYVPTSAYARKNAR